MPTDPLSMPGCLCAWDFQEPAGAPRRARGRFAYALQEGGGPVERVDDGVMGRHAARFAGSSWLRLARADCPGLDVHGPQAQVTVAAWVRREAIAGYNNCQAVAGIWNEYGRRQYCMFLNLGIHDSREQVGAHISGIGGPTPDFPYCMDAAIGATPVPFDAWHHVAITYDGTFACAWLDGRLDERGERNPYRYDLGIFDPGADGGDFTVGAVQRPARPHDHADAGSFVTGNWYRGLLGSLAVWDRALAPGELARLAQR